ncbi:MAG: sigma-70 family RNA polymerase sigma factor [Candidatus Gastranaerophilales bacterium]|nr:sigma-70 family RNA polymerase sigma factor [Candidatus Gastranaerophilales bacterium]
MELDEIRLIRQAQKGKKDALETLFLTEKEYLYKMAFLYMKNKEDALDLVQECILQCILNLKKLKKPEYFRTWATRILINCARSEWKKRGRYTVTEDAELWEKEELPKEEVSREEKLDLYEAIDKLSFPYRAIIIQYYFAGSKLNEVAELLNMPLGTVKAYHARAKCRLKEILEGE